MTSRVWNRILALAVALGASTAALAGDSPWQQLKKKLDQASGNPSKPAAKTAPPSSADQRRKDALAWPQDTNISIDVLGVKVGKSTLEEARAALAEHLPGREISEYGGRDHGLRVASPVRTAAEDRGAYALVGRGRAADRVVRLHRIEHYLAGDGPTPEKLHASFLEKYGPPTGQYQAGSTYRLWWVFDRAGHRMAAMADGRCLAKDSEPSHAVGDMLELGCAGVLDVQIDAWKGVVTSFTVDAADIQAAVVGWAREVDDQKGAQAKSDAEHRQSAEKAGVPSL